jgi:hypothetical protein
MKKIWSLLFVVLTLNSVAQTKSNLVYDNNAQKRSVLAFKGVKVSSAIDLYLTQSDVNEVAVSASSNEIRDRIITEVEEGVLVIRFENSGWRSWSWGDQNESLCEYKKYRIIASIWCFQCENHWFINF